MHAASCALLAGLLGSMEAAPLAAQGGGFFENYDFSDYNDLRVLIGFSFHTR